MGTMVLITIPTVTYHFVRGAPGASKDLRLEGSTPPSRD
jgi:hypothetical protein